MRETRPPNLLFYPRTGLLVTPRFYLSFRVVPILMQRKVLRCHPVATLESKRQSLKAQQVLLMPYVPVNRNKNVVVFFCQRQQLAVFFATPTCIPDRFTKHSLSREQKLDLSRHAFIQQKFHRRASARLTRASSSAAIASSRVTLGKSSRNSFKVRPCSM